MQYQGCLSGKEKPLRIEVQTGRTGEDMKISEYGYRIETGMPGRRDSITDVPGVRVGHATIHRGRCHTGVTAVLPCEGFAYLEKPAAAVYVENGFGKTIGTIQLEELGCLETPILLTNTLNVGKAADALVEYTLAEGKKRGLEIRTVNPVVGETNDSRINDIARRAVGRKEVLAAIASASEDFEQGAVGAGTGTVCFGLKGGIGSASRIYDFAGRSHVLGVLVQSNFGRLEDLQILGDPIGRRIQKELQEQPRPDQGSIMVVAATDIPLTCRQLRRVLKRAAVGLARTGSYFGHGSGDVFLGFCTANRMKTEGSKMLPLSCLPEERLEDVFRLMAEAVEEAVLNSLTEAQPAQFLDGRTCHSLAEFLGRCR